MTPFQNRVRPASSRNVLSAAINSENIVEMFAMFGLVNRVMNNNKEIILLQEEKDSLEKKKQQLEEEKITLIKSVQKFKFQEPTW
ncbi:hypothetical protein DIX77_10065 [Streptococcus iniae]|nr:hypothetical protein DIX77_10065 [Streptococcus iniae]